MIQLTFLAWFVATLCPSKPDSNGVPGNRSANFYDDDVVQVITLNGNKVAEITSKGEIWIGGSCAGSIEKSGEIWVAGTKEGEITSSGEVWKAGEQFGEITDKGEVWKNSEQVGSLEKDGTVWIDGSADGFFEGGKRETAAIVLFFEFFEFE